jgi:hypothetical protein
MKLCWYTGVKLEGREGLLLPQAAEYKGWQNEYYKLKEIGFSTC